MVLTSKRGWDRLVRSAHENRPPYYALAYIMKLKRKVVFHFVEITRQSSDFMRESTYRENPAVDEEIANIQPQELWTMTTICETQSVILNRI